MPGKQLPVPYWKRKNRSKAKITKTDLKKLLKLTRSDYNDFVKRHPKYKSLNIMSICLCQGAALHYVDGKNGIRDFDTYIFFDNKSAIRYPVRRIGYRDFGKSKFGKTFHHPGKNVNKHKNEKGRSIDIMGRQIEHIDNDYKKSIKKWLQDAKSDTPYFLSQKAVVVLEPKKDLGEVIWKPSDKSTK